MTPEVRLAIEAVVNELETDVLLAATRAETIRLTRRVMRLRQILAQAVIV